MTSEAEYIAPDEMVVHQRLEAAAWEWPLRPAPKLLALALIHHTDLEGTAVVSVHTLAEQTGLHPRTVRRAMKEMVAGGFVTRSRRRVGRDCHRYQLREV